MTGHQFASLLNASESCRTRRIRRRRALGCDRGSALVEIVIVAPIVALGLMFVAWSISQPEAEGAAHAAARAAARAAALAESPTAAQAAGTAAGSAAGAESGCVTVVVTIDTSQWRDGWVNANVRCEPRTDGLGGLGSAKTMTAAWPERVQQVGRLGQ